MKPDAVVAGVADIVGADAAARSPDDLMVEASLRALADAGVPLDAVDGVFCASPNDNMPALRLAESLKLHPRHFDSTSVGGGSYESFVGHAALALAAGECDVALLAYGSAQRSARGRFSTRSTPPPLEAVAGLLYPVSSFALMASRYMHVHGATPEDLAAVAVASRRWSRHNPRAAKREEITVADVLASPMVSSPLHKLDCCLVTDGAGAVVMTRRERVADLASVPVHVLGFADAFTHRYVSHMPDLRSTSAAQSGPAAMAMAGVRHEDVDLLQLYDAFTIDVLLLLEDLGFCEPGAAGAFVRGGGTSPDGALPTNTNGGGLAYAHPGMFGIFLLVEAVRQLRGEAEGLQVEAEVALVHGLGGPLSSGSTVVLGATAA